MNLTTLAAYTQFGRVFPLEPGTKKPLVKWKRGATENLETIDKWLNIHPNAGWALVPDRAFIVDVDVKNGATGPESIQSSGGLSDTFTVRTPSGGSHHYYAPDSELPLKTRNAWLPGVDIRYGGDGYVVLPYTKTTEGKYVVETDLDDLETCPHGATPSGSILPKIPNWIKTKILEDDPEPSKKSRDKHTSKISICDMPWDQVRKAVKYMFFRNQKNIKVWNYQPVDGMVDRSQSGYEWQLAMRLMNVGATDEEIVTAYRVWCYKHELKIKQRRFITQVIPNARVATAEYIARWKASQPIRRKHGTTTGQIIDAIQAGFRKSSEIENHTGLKGSSIRMQLKRMLEKGELVRDSSGYALPGVPRPVAESEWRRDTLGHPHCA